MPSAFFFIDEASSLKGASLLIWEGAYRQLKIDRSHYYYRSQLPRHLGVHPPVPTKLSPKLIMPPLKIHYLPRPFYH